MWAVVEYLFKNSDVESVICFLMGDERIFGRGKMSAEIVSGLDRERLRFFGEREMLVLFGSERFLFGVFLNWMKSSSSDMSDRRDDEFREFVKTGLFDLGLTEGKEGVFLPICETISSSESDNISMLLGVLFQFKALASFKLEERLFSFCLNCLKYLCWIAKT